MSEEDSKKNKTTTIVLLSIIGALVIAGFALWLTVKRRRDANRYLPQSFWT
jgi:LPXTG-motif cell wall-anchored protein